MCSLKKWKMHFVAFTKQVPMPLGPVTMSELKQLLNMPVVPCSCVRKLPLSRENGKMLRERSAFMKIQSSRLHLQRLYCDKQAYLLLTQNHIPLFIMSSPLLLGDSSLEEYAKGFAPQNLPFSVRFYKLSVLWEDGRNEAISPSS